MPKTRKTRWERMSRGPDYVRNRMPVEDERAISWNLRTASKTQIIEVGTGVIVRGEIVEAYREMRSNVI